MCAFPYWPIGILNSLQLQAVSWQSKCPHSAVMHVKIMDAMYSDQMFDGHAMFGDAVRRATACTC